MSVRCKVRLELVRPVLDLLDPAARSRAVGDTRVLQNRDPRQKENERRHFQKGLRSLGSSSRLVHLPGRKAPDLLHGVVSLFEVRFESLTASPTGQQVRKKL